jgi:hypothetical protein
MDPDPDAVLNALARLLNASDAKCAGMHNSLLL